MMDGCAPCTSSGVTRANGRRQCGASACSAPFACVPVVSTSVECKSWNVSQKSRSPRSPPGGALDAPDDDDARGEFG